MDTLEEIKIIQQLIIRRANGPTSKSQTLHGLNYKLNYGISIPELKEISNQFANNHNLAIALFEEDVREFKINASMIDDPEQVTGEQIDSWAQSFVNIEIVEQVCSNLLWKTEYALSRSIEWCLSGDELLQKAGLIIAARRATDPEVKDAVFEPYIDIIENVDDENAAFNKSTLAYTLRQIAHRSEDFTRKVLLASQRLAESENEHKAWIGNQLIFELEGDT